MRHFAGVFSIRVRERTSPYVLSRKGDTGWWIVTHTKAQEYRRLAKECLAMARSVSTKEVRDSLRQMAQVWHRLADELEQGSELGSMPVQQQQQVQPKDGDKNE